MTEATRYADLEIGLHRRQEDAYTVEMRFERPGSDADSRSDDAQARFDLNALRACANDPAAYGQALTESLFKDSADRSAFERARDLAKSQTPPLGLRVRLAVGPSAPELHPRPHRLRWLAQPLLRQLLVRRPQHIHMNVHPIQQQPGDALLIARHCGRRAGALTRQRSGRPSSRTDRG